MAKKAGLAAYLNLASLDELSSLRSRDKPFGLVCREGLDRPKPFASHCGALIAFAGLALVVLLALSFL